MKTIDDQNHFDNSVLNFPQTVTGLKLMTPYTYLAKILLFILTGFTVCPHFTRIKVKLLRSYSLSHDYAVVAFP